ncbi:glycosyltransferase [Sphingomonas sp. J344]|uniref:glycosyltransferase n=1 Tax=Sphingomonas sp. J344 TaxID=2898434 RepID=UPI002151F4AE|nr:glycosyltransferase [Sphingomonas sp. J344]MCR5872579.1 glycosyltransferase [Sphingomonas sp. J344]
MLRVLTLSSLFPDATRPNFGVFVERQTLGLVAHHDVELKLIAPLGLPPWPLSRLGRYAGLSALPRHEHWKGVETWRPRFVNLPGTGGRFHAATLVARLKPMLRAIRRDFAFDVIDASFFFPTASRRSNWAGRLASRCRSRRGGADIHHWGRAPATAAQVLNAGRNADGLLAVAGSMRDDMAALGMDADKIRVHRTGVDLDRFAPRDRMAAKAALGVAGPLVASVGALIPRKGHEIVIDAVAALPGVRLMIAGEGPERPKLAGQIARLGLGDRVTLMGSIAHGELPGLLAAADVMALASSSEGLANAWVEALASGTPVVIPDAGGARELVTAPEHGRIVARNAAAFAEAIGAILAAPPPPDAVRAGAAGFTWEANRDALYAHLAGLVRR